MSPAAPCGSVTSCPFTDVASSEGVADTGSGRGVAFGDVDGDGDLDLYLANYGSANRLYLNDGSGTFTEVGSTAGVADTGYGEGVVFADICLLYTSPSPRDS